MGVALTKFRPTGFTPILCATCATAWVALGPVKKATLSSDYGVVNKHRIIDQVVVNHGTLPLEALYFDLKPMSSDAGELDQDAFINGTPQTVKRNDKGQFQLFRIGDAVAARNVHAAIYDALRLMKDI